MGVVSASRLKGCRVLVVDVRRGDRVAEAEERRLSAELARGEAGLDEEAVGVLDGLVAEVSDRGGGFHLLAGAVGALDEVGAATHQVEATAHGVEELVSDAVVAVLDGEGHVETAHVTAERDALRTAGEVVRDRGALDEEQVAGVDEGLTADVGAELTNAGAELAADRDVQVGVEEAELVGAGAVAEVDLDAVADVAGGGAGGVETGVADREAAEVGVALALVERADTAADLHAAILEARHAGGESLDVLVELGPVVVSDGGAGEGERSG